MYKIIYLIALTILAVSVANANVNPQPVLNVALSHYSAKLSHSPEVRPLENFSETLKGANIIWSQCNIQFHLKRNGIISKELNIKRIQRSIKGMQLFNHFHFALKNVSPESSDSISIINVPGPISIPGYGLPISVFGQASHTGKEKTFYPKINNYRQRFVYLFTHDFPIIQDVETLAHGLGHILNLPHASPFDKNNLMLSHERHYKITDTQCHIARKFLLVEINEVLL